jgi:hypothetical protein
MYRRLLPNSCLYLARGLLLLILAVGTLAGCSSFDAGPAEEVGKTFYGALQAHEYERAVALCGDECFGKIDRPGMARFLQNLDDKLGDVQSYEVVNHTVLNTAGTRAGSNFTLRYKVTHSKYASDDTLTLFRPLGSNTVQVVGYHVNSTGLVQ